METSTRFNADDRPLGELVQDLSRQTSTLIRQEMRLAQAELAEKGRHAGKGAGMFGGAGLVALYGVGALIAAAILGLATVNARVRS
jgi:membrane protein